MRKLLQMFIKKLSIISNEKILNCKRNLRYEFSKDRLNQISKQSIYIYCYFAIARYIYEIIYTFNNLFQIFHVILNPMVQAWLIAKATNHYKSNHYQESLI